MVHPDAPEPRWQLAASFAAWHHRGGLRKDKRTPYIAHPARVALTVAGLFGETDHEILAAALLHDTIEDTGVDYDEIKKEFGRRVADIVAALTKDMRMIEDEREAAYDERLRRGPWEARLIKLADVYDNLSEAPDDQGRRKILDKARRALALAAGDPQAAKARELVAALIERTGGIG